MLHVRIAAPQEHADTLAAILCDDPAVCDVMHLRGVGTDAGTDLLLADVARERASSLMVDVSRLGLGDRVSVSLLEIAAMVSPSAQEAVRAAGGRPTDAVVWEEVEQRTAQRAGLSGSYLAFMVISVLIAAVALITDSQVLLVGAMIVGPDFGPLAGLCVGIAERRRRPVTRALVALVVGFGVAMVAALLLTLVVRGLGAGPAALTAGTQPFTGFIADPDGFSALIAVLCGVGGLLTLTQSRSGALIGILVSVTTIPAVANMGVAAAYGDGVHVKGAAVQLLVNVVAFVAAGTVTYAVQRSGFRRRMVAPGVDASGTEVTR